MYILKLNFNLDLSLMQIVQFRTMMILFYLLIVLIKIKYNIEKLFHD